MQAVIEIISVVITVAAFACSIAIVVVLIKAGLKGKKE
jgi:hypothetical protein